MQEQDGTPWETPRLTTSLRQLEQQDIKTTQEVNPPPTFTVPAFRRRPHRGDSTFLKDVYPSGFCPSKSEHRLLPTTERPRLARCSKLTRGILSGRVGLGVPKWGKPSQKQIMTVTYLRMGAESACEIAGNELVQFGPAVCCGPTERLSPAAAKPRLSRPNTPLSSISKTINGSFLKGRIFSGTCASHADHEAGNTWPRRKLPRSPCRENQNPHRRLGRKRGRPVTGDRTSTEGIPEPWPYSLYLSGRQGGTGRGTRTFDLAASDPRGRAEVVIAQGGMDKDEAIPHAETGACNVSFEVVEVSDARLTANLGSTVSVVAANDVQLDKPDKEKKDSQDVSTSSRLARQEDPGQIQLVTLVGEDGHSEGGEMRHGLPMDDRSILEKQEGEALEGLTIDECSKDEDGEVSACPSDSVVMLEPSCESLASDDSVEHASPRRGFSSLDSERYGGTLTRNAYDIVRSRIEPGLVNSAGESGACFKDTEQAHDGVAPPVGISTVLSPVHLPSPRLNLAPKKSTVGPRQIAHRSNLGYLEPFQLPWIERSGCYVRMGSDVLLALVKREELRACTDGTGLRRVKQAARPVRIKAGTKLTEGINAILASGVIQGEGGRFSAIEDAAMEPALPLSIAYFNALTGTWETIRNESDWKMLLEAPATPQGAGTTFSQGSSERDGRDAGLLVTVAAAGKEKGAAMGSPGPSKNHVSETFIGALQRHIRGRQQLASVTPGALQQMQERNANVPDGNSLANVGMWRSTNDADTNISPRWIRRCSLMLPPKGVAVTNSRVMKFGDVQVDAMEFGRQLAGLMGGGRRQGPGPGGGLWVSGSTGKRSGDGASHLPMRAKTRHTIRFLEARLALQGNLGAGGLPRGPSQPIDMPYSKTLAKWGYDEILGIPRTALARRGPFI